MNSPNGDECKAFPQRHKLLQRRRLHTIEPLNSATSKKPVVSYSLVMGLPKNWREDDSLRR